MSRVSAQNISIDIDGQRIVDAVDLDVESGTFVGLVGPNGSGKSSLLRTIYRVLKPRTGRVTVDGEDIWALSARETAQRVAVVAQERMGEFDFTVGELVLMGRHPHQGMFDSDTAEDQQIVDRCLDLVSMHDRRHRQFMSLSGGEKQRVLMARALAQRARFMVLDEPTNHLDIRYQLDLLGLIRRLDVTALAALHDLNLAARYCDRIVMLSDGRVVAAGTPTEVLTAERIAEVYEVGADVIAGGDGVPQIRFFPLAATA
ncbi:ABC transporter ATP-binding protein [Fodinicurvata sp. EGI_FJ10296]|uniref:ABC transporter ATP-binding protein n=1 Tax=Fodinicurvata sp. EGI_FJ10296 TaxID=3231908 RepID=UPI003453B253